MGDNQMTVGERAVKAIRQRAKENGVPVCYEQEKLDLPRKTFRTWAKENMNPSAYFLAQMALQGYDIHYILTGEDKNG